MATDVDKSEWHWRDYFKNDSRGFKCERQLGVGGYGEAWLVKHEVDSRLEKRFVAKFSLTSNPDDIESIETEIRLMKKLYGTMHVAQPIVSGGEMLELDSIPNSQRRIILMTELVPGLTVAQFFGRITEDMDRRWPVPNRILWLIFRCLVRSVMAMAQPPDRPYGESNEPPTLESLPANEPTKEDYQIHHGDWNPSNLIFGELDSREHSLVPILKIIDFGVARDSPGFPGVSRTATQANIRDMTVPMKLLTDCNSPNLDEELRDLVNQCSNLDPQKRPKLATLFGTIQNAVLLKTGPQYFAGKPRAWLESTNRIRQYVQQMMLDAEIG